MRILCLLVVFFGATLFGATLFGAQHTFVLQDVDSNQFLIEEGDTTTRLSPYCSFNIVLSLIGFETNVLRASDDPVWAFQEEYKTEYKTWNDTFPEKWEASHDPTSWMKNGCVWFSQVLSQQFGMKNFEDYVTALGYGNQNVVGDPDKENGLTRAWLGSSLRISPFEQVLFVNRLVKHELPISIRAQEMTKAILFVEQLPNGMKLYGKTGSGSHALGQDSELRIGWFVGWAEQGDRRIAFAYMIQGSESSANISGSVAREELKQRLLQ